MPTLADIREHFALSTDDRRALRIEAQLKANARYNTAHVGKCEGECRDGDIHVFWVRSMTAYTHKEGEEDPNRDREFCPECRDDYIQHWTEMWDEYNRDRL